jgi:3(or 17)beta-hydroxysteroid dehydrogenase
MARLDGKITLVTGGAMGIGAATARAFAAEGAAAVWIADRDEAKGRQQAEALGEVGRFLHLDVTDEEAWVRAAQRVGASHDRLDVLVHNAGGGVLGDIESTTLEAWRFVQRLNVESVFLGTQKLYPLLEASGNASVVVLSSVAGIVGDPNMPAYCAAKGAVRMLSKSLALHGAKRGIRVNSVHPSFTRTPLVESMIAASPEGMEDRLVKASPLRRMAEAGEIAAMILYLASDESRFVTGAEMVIDGGLTAR